MDGSGGAHRGAAAAGEGGTRAGNDRRRAAPRSDFLGTLLGFAIRPINFVLGAAFRVLDAALTVLFYPLRMLAAPPAPRSPEEDAREFASFFRNKFGAENCPVFIEDSIAAASRRAREDDRVLLVYLHCDENDDANDFCRDVLCAEGFRTFADEHMLLWAGSVDRPDGRQLANELQATAFPFLALLSPRASGTRLAAVDRIEGSPASHPRRGATARSPAERAGPMDAVALLDRVSAALESVQDVLEHRRAERVAREAERRLREEQERELEEAMARDGERLDRAQREEEELRREEEERQRRQEEERRAANEARAAREAAAAKVPDEPAPGSTGVVAIRFNMPDGSRVQRRFWGTNTLGEVHGFVAARLHDGDSAILRFVLSSNFPRRKFTEDDHDSTLDDLGLRGGVALFVQDLDA